MSGLKPVYFVAKSAGDSIDNPHVTRDKLAKALRYHRAKGNAIKRTGPHSYFIDGLVKVWITPRIFGYVVGGAV